MAIVEISRLTKTYGRVTAVTDFSLAVDEGTIFALVGPDGAGKTTVFRALCGLIGFDSGSIRLAGLDVLREFAGVKSHLGYMPQTFSLYQDLSVEENLNFYAGLFGVGGGELARKKQTLYEFSGLGPFRGRRAGQLSGGMKQKLSLSCTLVHDPDVLVLDEPTTGVDPVSRQQFWDILKNLEAQGSTILVSTPYMDEVALVGRAAFVYGGRVLAEGSPSELADRFEGRIFRIRGGVGAEAFAGLAAIPELGARRVGGDVYLYPAQDLAVERLRSQLAAAGIARQLLEEARPSVGDAFIQLMGK